MHHRFRPAARRLAAAIAALYAAPLFAAPTSPTYISGSGTLSGNTLTINAVNAKNNALIHWGNFSIGKTETFNVKDGVGGAGMKNIVNVHGGANPAQLSGGLYADNTLRVLLVSPTGVNIDSTATIKAGNFAAFAGNAVAQPDGQIVITGNGAPINQAAGAAILANRTGFAVGAGQPVTFQVPSYIEGTLPWLDGGTTLRVDNALQADGELATLVGNIRSGQYDMQGGNLVLTGLGESGSATVTNAKNVTLRDLQLGQGTLAEGAQWQYDDEGNLILAQPGQAGKVSGFNLTVGAADAPVNSLTVQDVRVLGTSRIDGYADRVTTAGTNKLTGQLHARTASLGGTLDGFRQEGHSEGVEQIPGGGYATVTVTEGLDVAGLTVKDDHILDVRMRNTAPLVSSGGMLDIQDAFVFLRTLGSNVTLDGWNVTGAETTADSGNNQLHISAATGTMTDSGRAVGAEGWLDVTLQGVTSNDVYLRIDNGTLTDRGIRDVALANTTINQGNNKWSGVHIEPARSVTLEGSRIDVPNGALEGNRTLVTTRGYNGTAGVVTLQDSTVRGADVILGGGYGQLQNAGLGEVTALNPDYVPGSEPNGTEWYNSGSYWSNLLNHANSYKLSYDPVTGRVDAARNTGTVTMSNSVVEGLATAKVGAKTSVSLDSQSRVEALNVADAGMTLISANTINYSGSAAAQASRANLYKGTVSGSVAANPASTQSDGSASAQAYIAAPTVNLAGLIKAGGGPAEGTSSPNPHACELNPASCYVGPGTPDAESNPLSPTTDISDSVISQPAAPGQIGSLAPGETPIATPIVIGTPGTGSTTAPVITDIHGNPVPVVLTPGGSWVPVDNSYFETPPAVGSTVTVGGNNWVVGTDGSLTPIVGGTYDFGSEGTPPVTWNGEHWVAQPTPGTTITSGGVNWEYDGSQWEAVLTPGQTLTQGGNNYEYDGSQWTWIPSVGDTASSGGIDYTYDGGSWVATPSPGTTVSSDGIDYTYDGSVWTPSAGSTTTSDGRDYVWDGDHWTWTPSPGTTVTEGGTQYTYDGSTWVPQYTPGQTTTVDGRDYAWDGDQWVWQPGAGEQIVQGGAQYTYDGSTWIPATGTTTTIDGHQYTYDGSGWTMTPSPGESITDGSGTQWTWNGSDWTPATGTTTTYGGNSYTWDGSGWVPAPGSTVSQGGNDYAWDGDSWEWVPSTGSTVTHGGTNYVYDGSGWVPQYTPGQTTSSGGHQYTWDGDSWVWTPSTGEQITQGGIGYTWNGSAWVPATGSQTNIGGNQYQWDGDSWVWAPSTGSSMTDGSGTSWTWDGSGWTPASGTTTTVGGNDYTWTGSTWLPAPGSTVSQGGNSYEWDGSSWTWTPSIGAVVTHPGTGLPYEWTGSIWIPAPTVGQTIGSGGSNYSWTGSAWQPVPGTTATIGNQPYTWNGSNWVWAPTPGTVITGSHSIPYVWTGSQWTAQPLPGMTIGSGGIGHGTGSSWTWTGSTWRPANGTTTTGPNGVGYVWQGGGWTPAPGSLPTLGLEPTAPQGPEVVQLPTGAIPVQPQPISTDLDELATTQLKGKTLILPVKGERTGGVGNWRVYLGAEKIAR